MPLLLMQRPLAPASGAPAKARRPSSAAGSSKPAPLLSSPFVASAQSHRPFSAPPARATPPNISAARSASPLAPLTFIPGTLPGRRRSGSGGGGAGSRPAPASAAAAATTTVADAAAAVLAPPPSPRPPFSPSSPSTSSLDEETHHQVRRRHVDDDDPPAPPDFLAKYMLGELLGRGASASVRVAVDRATGQLSAAKLLRRRVGRGSKGRRDRSAALAAEVAACRRLQAARHAARLHGVFESEEAVAIVSELLPGGDLSDLLAHAPEGRLDEREAAACARAALEFVADAHALGFVVGDVKPQNFALRRLYPSARHLADPVGHPSKGALDVAAIDFGCCVDFAALAAARSGGGGRGAAGSASSSPLASPLASPLSSRSASPSASSDEDEVCVVLPSLLQPAGAAGSACAGGGSSSSSPAASRSPPPSASSSQLPSPSSLSPLISGTPIYMAPEVLKGCASPSSDVWACGVMLYELLTGQFPFWREPAADVAALGARAVTEAINHGPVLFPRDPFAASSSSSSSSSSGGGGGLRPSVQTLLLGMLQRDPARRLTAAQAAEHPWFREVLHVWEE